MQGVNEQGQIGLQMLSIEVLKHHTKKLHKNWDFAEEKRLWMLEVLTKFCLTGLI